MLVPDVLGAGGTDKPRASDYTPRELADHLAGLLDALGIERVHVVGTDTGMLVAAAFAGSYPDRTIRVVLSAGTVYPRDITSWEIRLMSIPLVGEVAMYNPLLGWVLEHSLRKGFVERGLASREMCDECVGSLRAPGGRRAALRTIRSAAREVPFLEECLKKIRGRALVVFADRDCYFPLGSGERFAATWGVDFKVIPECGHFLQEEKPDTFNRIVLEFIGNGNGTGAA